MDSHNQHIVIDLEFNPIRKTDIKNKLDYEIIEIGAVRINAAGLICDSFSRLVQPELNDSIAPRVGSMTGIRFCDVACAPKLKKVLSDFTEWIGSPNARMVSWSRSDQIQLNAECACKEIRLPEQMGKWLDLQAIYPKVMGIASPGRQMSLRDAAAWYGTCVDPSRAHRALYDAEIAAMMMSQLITGDYMEQREALDSIIPVRKNQKHHVLTSNIGSMCAGLTELKTALAASH